MPKNFDHISELVFELFAYDKSTGEITRRITRGSQKAGSQAGCFDVRGYLRIDVAGHRLMGHRVAFLLGTGRWPTMSVDHINGNPSDNRMDNLRECTDSENSQHRMIVPKSRSGVRGVRFDPKASRIRPWQVFITKNYKEFYIGRYATKEEAVAARYAASAKYHGEFAGRIEAPTTKPTEDNHG